RPTFNVQRPTSNEERKRRRLLVKGALISRNACLNMRFESFDWSMRCRQVEQGATWRINCYVVALRRWQIMASCKARNRARTSFTAHTEESTSGYGPPTSLPPNFSVTKPAARPKQNWIDQSQAAADAKSIGCNQCHHGVEPMHQASHVVLGCTDCHGGNPARG